jgi:integrase
MTKTNLKLVAPSIEIRTVVTPRRKTNAEYRTGEHLTPAEVDQLLEAAKRHRHGCRDATMLLVAYHLRVRELIDLRWDQIDFDTATLHVRRVNQGTPATHPIAGDELRALRRLQREQSPPSPFVFTSERGSPFTTSGFAKWSSAPAPPPSWGSRSIRTCCAMPAASRWPTRVTTAARCRPISGTETSSTPCATPRRLRLSQ